jgi:hypothetical protein
MFNQVIEVSEAIKISKFWLSEAELLLELEIRDGEVTN